MYRVAVLTGLIACYRPAHELPCTIACTTECPAGLACIAGLCRQADGSCGGSDAAPGDVSRDTLDAVAAPCVLGSFNVSETMYMPGFDYASGGTKSVYQALFNDDDLWETAADSIAPGSQLALGVFSGYIARGPRLAPTGDELFFMGNIGGTYNLMRSLPDVGGHWQPATAVTVSPVGLLTAALMPGVPTATTPRHMMVSSDNQSNFVEGVEDPTGAWSFAETYTAGAWGLATMTTPNLSSDGKHLVFTGTLSTTQIYITSRADVGGTFPEPTILHDLEHGDPEFTATLSPDCSRLYVSSSGPPIVWKLE